jgi:hypothetical protein
LKAIVSMVVAAANIWGSAMGKRVLFLREQSFAHGRADIGALRAWDFDWNAPEAGIRTAITDYFGPPVKEKAW